MNILLLYCLILSAPVHMQVPGELVPPAKVELHLQILQAEKDAS